MKIKAHDEFERIMARFYGFCDGIIRSLRLQYEADGTRHVELLIASRDAEATENEGWVSVRILVRNAQEFVVREQTNTTLQVLSEGLHIQTIDDGVGIEFGGALEPPRTKKRLAKNRRFCNRHGY